jgi:predicted SprT family Zn-dependent metalloprotease
LLKICIYQNYSRYLYSNQNTHIMKLYDAEKLAKSLMTENGLDARLFNFTHAKRVFGVCKYKRNRLSGEYTLVGIGLSKYLVLLNDEEQVRDTILHEIAHALTLGDGHGERWKRMCVKIGCKPIRCYTSEEVVQPKLKYSAECGGCGTEFQKARLPKHNGRQCCKCQVNKGWNDRILLTFKERK